MWDEELPTGESSVAYQTFFELESLIFLSPNVPRNTGEMRLMWAVLSDALSLYQGRYNTDIGREAEAWIYTDDERYLFSYINCCSYLGIDYLYLRRKLREQREKCAKVGTRSRFRIM